MPDYACVAILVGSNVFEVHGAVNSRCEKVRNNIVHPWLLTPHSGVSNFTFHRTISRAKIAWGGPLGRDTAGCQHSGPSLLNHPSSNCSAVMRSLASWGMMIERSDLVNRSSYCAGNFQDQNLTVAQTRRIYACERGGFSIVADYTTKLSLICEQSRVWVVYISRFCKVSLQKCTWF